MTIDVYVIAIMAAGYILMAAIIALSYKEIKKREDKMAEYAIELKEREENLEEWEDELEKWEDELNEHEEELNEWADELEERKKTLQEAQESLKTQEERITLTKKEFDERERRWKVFASDVIRRDANVIDQEKNLEKFHECLMKQRESFNQFSSLMTGRLIKLRWIADKLVEIKEDHDIEDERFDKAIDQIEKLIADATKKREKSNKETCKPPKIGRKSHLKIGDALKIDQDIKTHHIA